MALVFGKSAVSANESSGLSAGHVLSDSYLCVRRDLLDRGLDLFGVMHLALAGDFLTNVHLSRLLECIYYGLRLGPHDFGMCPTESHVLRHPLVDELLGSALYVSGL